MKVIFLDKFDRDAAKIKDPTAKKAIIKLIERLEAATSITDIPNVKKLSGHPSAYRVRLGDFRVGFFMNADTVELARVAHRKDIYSKFP